MAETILQHWVVTNFILPFLLIFFIVFGILEKSKLFGANKQLNALISFVIGLIFVGAIFPKLVVGNLILFLTVAVVVMFVALLLWGFVGGEEGLKFEKFPKPIKYVIGITIVVAVIIATLWATGVQGTVWDFIFRRNWSSEFWTNVSFIVVIIIALAAVLGASKKSG
jgi:hypothetical protein